MDVVVAGFGNVLRGDDGFGGAVVRALLEEPLPAGVRVLEVGIGGIHLVQELMGGVDALIVLDAVDLGRPPGTVAVIEPDVTDVADMAVTERRDHLADMHYATPERALMLAQGLGVLPRTTLVVGCQPGGVDELGEGLSGAVERGVQPAAAEVRRIVTELGVEWPAPIS